MAKKMQLGYREIEVRLSLTPNPSPRGEGSIYTLDGRRVAQPKKGGLYIVNGKKVVIK